MNRLNLDRRAQVVSALVEGNSVRSTERMTGIHRDTIMRLVEVGTGCAELMEEKMRELPCRRVQCDEIWSYVGKKQRHVKLDDNTARVGDQWTFVAIDAETKLVPAYRVGKRTWTDASIFMRDLSSRLARRVQLLTDGLAAYADAVERAFGADVDYGQEVKFYEADPVSPGRYSPPRVVSLERTAIAGNPDVSHISTSYIESARTSPCA
jgi:IS1 family transposase